MVSAISLLPHSFASDVQFRIANGLTKVSWKRSSDSACRGTGNAKNAPWTFLYASLFLKSSRAAKAF